MRVPVGNLVISRSNHDISFTFGLTAAILIFCGRGLKYFDTQNIRKNVLVIPYRLAINRMEKIVAVPEIQGGAAFAPPAVNVTKNNRLSEG